LVHATRIRDLNVAQPPSAGFTPEGGGATFVSDTGELAWQHLQKRQGCVTIDTDRSQALIGFIQCADQPLKDLAATVENEFCSLVLTSLDDKPIAQADRLLLVATARAANSGMKWNDKRTSLTDWGTEPSVIEPVKGFVTLKGLAPAGQIEAVPLDSGAKPLGKPIPVEKTSDGYRLPIGEPATPWYLVRITRPVAPQAETGFGLISEDEQVWVKCGKCGQSYQMGLRQFFVELEAKSKANSSSIPVLLPLKCANCGQDGVRRAYKCSQCGEVFSMGSVRGDFQDKCPKCGYSATEAKRKAGLSGDR
jgi:DNA-directed RNA polymerase subunit RPC12/RpoP